MGDGGRAEGAGPLLFFFFSFFLIKWAEEKVRSGRLLATPWPGLQRALQDAAGRRAGLRARRMCVRVPRAGRAARSGCSGSCQGRAICLFSYERRDA